MSRFTDTLTVSPLPDGRNWVLRSDPDDPTRVFGYDVGKEGSGDEVVVPLHFTTDFASVPRPLWWALSPWGVYGNAAVIHDWLYWDQRRPRSECDRILLDAALVLGTSKLTAWTIYLGVRVGGWLAWSSNAKRKASGASKISTIWTH